MVSAGVGTNSIHDPLVGDRASGCSTDSALETGETRHVARPSAPVRAEPPLVDATAPQPADPCSPDRHPPAPPEQTPQGGRGLNIFTPRRVLVLSLAYSGELADDMDGRRIVEVLGVVCVWVGAVLAAQGPEGVAWIVVGLTQHMALILLCLATGALLYNIAPRGALPGPLLLGSAGLTVLAIRNQWWNDQDVWFLTGTALAIVGGLTVMRKRQTTLRSNPVRRIVGAIVRRRLVVEADQYAPERIVVLAICGRVEIDLRLARLPRYGPVEVMVSCWMSAVELFVANHWPVVAGRVHAARGIQLEGCLDSSELFDEPESEEQGERLVQLAKERQISMKADQEGSAIVVHVLGLGGSVSISGR